MMNRRDFLRKGLLSAAAVQFPSIWVRKLTAGENVTRLTILQTNDTHSRIDPFPMDGSKYQGLGGIARRSSLVNAIRSKNPNTLLLDAGDVFQGTPYFNLFKGKVEYQTMTACGYDVGTLGNHDFDNGVFLLKKAMEYAHFDFVNCNFDFGVSLLFARIKPWIIKRFDRIKIGITGVGVDFTDLVVPENHRGIQYLGPFKPLQSVVDYLRNDRGCQFIIVLSHLGYEPYLDKPGDTDLAYRVNGIDWIVGGHSHTFMNEPELIVSKGDYPTRILQVGFGGILLGKTDFIFEGQKLVSCLSENISVEQAFTASESVESMQDLAG